MAFSQPISGYWESSIPPVIFSRFFSDSPITIGIMQMEPDDKQTYIRDLVPTPTHNKLVVQVAEAIAV